MDERRGEKRKAPGNFREKTRPNGPEGTWSTGCVQYLVSSFWWAIGPAVLQTKITSTVCSAPAHRLRLEVQYVCVRYRVPHRVLITHSCFPHPHPLSRSGEQNKSEQRSECICRDVSERKSRLRRKRRLQLRGSWRRIGSVSHSDSRRLSQTSAEHIAWARRRQQQRATAGRQSARLRH